VRTVAEPSARTVEERTSPPDCEVGRGEVGRDRNGTVDHRRASPLAQTPANEPKNVRSVRYGVEASRLRRHLAPDAPRSNGPPPSRKSPKTEDRLPLPPHHRDGAISPRSPTRMGLCCPPPSHQTAGGHAKCVTRTVDRGAAARKGVFCATRGSLTASGRAWTRTWTAFA
jgi:hypothetical protein